MEWEIQQMKRKITKKCAHYLHIHYNTCPFLLYMLYMISTKGDNCSLWMVVAVVQLLSCVWLFATPWTAACQASLSFTVSRSLLKVMSIESMMSSILCHPLLFLTLIFHIIRVFSNESALHIRWPKYWSFSISPSNEYSGLISYGIDWFDVLAV